jgi:hypothetical protein
MILPQLVFHNQLWRIISLTPPFYTIQPTPRSDVGLPPFRFRDITLIFKTGFLVYSLMIITKLLKSRYSSISFTISHIRHVGIPANQSTIDFTSLCDY